MGWLITAAVVFWIFGLIQKASQSRLPPTTYEGFQAEELVHRALPAGRMQLAMEASSSEGEVDELAADTDLTFDDDVDDGEDATGDLVLFTPRAPVVLTTTEARPLPEAARALEAEVDWTAEHERFHRKYVDAPAQAHPPHHALLQELRDPESLRRAILMSEVLGPPVSSREPREF
ncbi:hypothetical protein [Longimicrobium terrae]|uniref:Uncharacterized protein n=1 Tax=Longimicrobium terrae TaxID=1639882 RepID=A0A841H7Q0_9BACT|nr:hypothetical protein [Longimicrobium terrae]MBB4639578.1 hypothetical protein [Longimicrobium terrae]MBB6073963.1 hypothetical protein [Longimicrobium terrae]NNC29127.1 hypothetical protein [Longimicrobium terrae]